VKSRNGCPAYDLNIRSRRDKSIRGGGIFGDVMVTGGSVEDEAQPCR
jgi:hypothetical protein